MSRILSVIFSRFNQVVLTGVLLLAWAAVDAQSTYTWSGGTGSWAVAANWTPTRTTPAANDILQFNDGGTYVVNAIPTQTIGQLLVTGSTNVTLQAATTNTLSINGPSNTNNLLVAQGSTLQTAATGALTITIITTANQQGSIAGTLEVRGGAFTTTTVGTTVVTVTGTGVVNHFAGAINGSAATLAFQSGATYNYNSATTLTVPTATWNNGSQVNITGVTTGAPGGLSQNFSSILWNCPGQSAEVTLTTFPTGISGLFEVRNTNTQLLSLNLALTRTWSGDMLISGGRLALRSAATANAGTFTVRDFTLNNTTNANAQLLVNNSTYTTAATSIIFATNRNFTITLGQNAVNANVVQFRGAALQTEQINIGGNFTQTGNFTGQINRAIAAGTQNIVFTGGTVESVYSAAKSNIIGTITTLNITGSTVDFGNNILTFTGNVALTNATAHAKLGADGYFDNTGTFSNVAGSSLTIGSQGGIATTGATGNVRSSGTRTFIVSANYIYTGTTGQITGAGLALGITGSITVNLSDGGALTLSNAGAGTIGAAGTLRMISGSLANQVTFSTTNTTLEYAGTAAQTTTNTEFPSTSGPVHLRINNASGVILHESRNLPSTGVLNLVSGVLSTSGTNLLTIQNTAVAAVVGGSSTSYVSGPLIRNLPSTSSGTYSFPVGKSEFAGLDFTITAATSSALTARVEYFESAPGGSAGSGLTALQDRYWEVQKTTGSGNLNNIRVALTTSGIVATTKIGHSSTLGGAYANIGGTGPANTITAQVLTSVSGTAPVSAYYTLGSSTTLSGTYTAVPAYNNLTKIADALRFFTVTGDVIFELPASYLPTDEPSYPVVFNAFDTTGGAWNVIIRPATGSTNFLTAGIPTGSNNPLINLDGIDRLTFDGRAGGTGNSVWTFRNTQTAATVGPTFQFINDATYNTLTYLNIQGQNIGTASGTIFFTTSASGSLGNSFNTVSNCDIRDRSDNTSNPVNAVFSLGTSGVMNRNNQILNNRIFNFWSPSTSSNGVFVSTHSTDWTISGNHFYQTAIRTGTASSIIRYAINVANAQGDDFVITDNYIGGSEELAAGTAWTIAGAFNQSFIGILINPITSATNSRVENNVIRNMAFTHAATANTVMFAGIRSDSGNSLIQGNTIGSQTASNKISVTTTLAAATNHVYGIFISAGVDTLVNNTVAGIELLSNTGASGLTGIWLGSAGNAVAQGNTVSDLSNAYTGALAVQTRGIATSTSGVNIIQGNTIFNLSSAAAHATVGHGASVIGIAQSSVTAGQVVAANTIHSLQNTAATAQVNIYGITFSSSVTASVNNVHRNFVHSLSLATTNLSSQIVGISSIAGVTGFYNNMIRLGINTAGGSITNGYVITGIEKVTTTNTHRHQFYYNTIYIGGSGVTSGNSNTYGFRKFGATASVANTEHFKNNIVINDRTNSGGTGTHYAVELINTTFFESDYNLFRVNATSGKLAFVTTGSLDYPLFSDWQNTFASNDLNSIYGPAGFINATGNAAAVNLRIQPGNATQVESKGIEIPGVNANINITVDGDIDNQPRGPYPNGDIVGTAPDIGADEGDFLEADLTPPAIQYTNIPTQVVLTPPTLSGVTITDNSGVNVTSGTAPRIYFKRSTDANTFAGNTSADNGWKFVESTTGSSPFQFVLNYSLLFGGTVSGGEVIQYFVTAQDLVDDPNVGINSGIYASLPTGVNLTAGAFPITGTINSYLINVFNNVVTVGTTGAQYTSLTNDGGLFQSINTGSLAGNVVAQIITDLTAETGTHGLQQWTELGAGNYTLQIRPNNATTRTISGSYAGTNAQNAGLIRFDGADRVIVDGRNPLDPGSNTRGLVFRNISTAGFAAAFNFVNDAKNDSLRYIVAEGASISATSGVIRISTALAGGSGNDFITIDNCHIRDRSDAAGLPANGIYALGTAVLVNDNITISNNEIFNFFNASGASNGVLIATSNTTCSILNNHFYQTAARTGTAASITRNAIQINNATGDNYTITGNFIGGSQANAGGSALTIAGAVDQTFNAISLTPASAATSIAVENNTIRNIALNHGTTANLSFFNAILQTAGVSTIKNNMIGDTLGTGSITLTTATGLSGTNGINVTGGNTTIENNRIGSITVAGTGVSVGNSFTAINSTGTGTANITLNRIGSLSTANSINYSTALTTSLGVRVVGISLGSSGSSTANNNVIANLNSNNTTTNTAAQVLGITTSATGVKTITNNTIYNLSHGSSSAGVGVNVSVAGILMQSATTTGNTVRGNRIYNIRNTHPSASITATGIVYAGATSGTHEVSKNLVHSIISTSSGASTLSGIYNASGLATFHNNMIRLGLDTAGTSIAANYLVHGMHHVSTTAGNNYFYNSVYVGGTGVTGSNSTAAFIRTAGSATISLRNNIFSNERTNGSGTGIHYAMSINSLTGLASPDGSNNNIFFSPGNPTTPIFNVSAGVSLSSWQSGNRDALSYYTNPYFINPTGNIANINLRLNIAIPTQAESNGFAVSGGPYGDFDNDIRFGEVGYVGTGTAPDIGADEAELIPIDLTPPVITYTPIPNQQTFTAPTLAATITDANGVEVSAGLRPRIYFKRTSDANTFVDNTSATNGWKFVETPSVSNNYSLTLNYSLLFGGSAGAGDTIQYFVIAQDIADIANVAINNAILNTAPASVNLSSANFPATGSINSYRIAVLNGTYEVNATGPINSLTNPGGLFELVNASVLSGNVTVNITSDLLDETGTVSLNQWGEINGSGYTLTIQSNNTTPKIIRSASGQGGSGLIRLTGADRVTFNGGTAAQRLLVIQNSSTNGGATTISLTSDATGNTFNNCVLEGSVVSTVNGVISITTGTSVGNDNNTFDRCDIRDYNGALPTNGIYSAGGSAATTNNNITVSNCNISNYFNAATTTAYAGILLGANTSTWNISNNNFFQTAARTVNAAVQPHSAIQINNATNGVGFTISGNRIGGAAADGSGTTTYTSGVAAQFSAIHLLIGSSVQSVVENNQISNISYTSISGATGNHGLFSAIYLGAAAGARVIGNTIGSVTVNDNISVTCNTNSGAIVNAIKSDATGTVKIENNIIGGMLATGTGTNNAINLYGIHFTAGNVAAKNNTIGSSTVANNMRVVCAATTNSTVLGGILGNTAAAVSDSLLNNQIHNLTNTNNGTGARVYGILGTSSGATQGQYIINDNLVRNLSTASTTLLTTTSASVMGIGLSTTNTGIQSVARNTIHSLQNTSAANSLVTGIYFAGGTNTANVVEQNFVHSLVPAQGSSATLLGIQYGAGAGTARNNMVRLGINPAGNSIDQAHILYGIDVVSTSATNVFHNSVYIGGAVDGTVALNSIAFRRTASSGTINIQNNIFVNARTQTSGGKHYCINTPNNTTFTSNYNILYAIGTGTFTGLFNTTDALTLANWRSASSDRDLNSSACDPAFVNPTGTAATVDLHLNSLTGTAAEGRGNPVALSPAVLLDFDGETRATPALNTVDVGADAGNYIALTGPTLSAQANSSAPLTICIGSAVTFSTTATGGSTCAAWQYSWFNGSLYWNGTAFASATEIFNQSWSTINVPSLTTGGTFTVRANCSGDLENCISTTQSTVVVNLNTSPATLTASIGIPANGASHFLQTNWSSISGVTAYELQVSTDNNSWNTIYTGANLSFNYNAGDTPNAPYFFRVRSIFGAEACNWTNATTFPIHTAADAPAVLVLSNPTPYTIDVALQAESPVANPSITTYSIFNATTSQFVQANGSLGATEIFRTMSEWGTVTVTGLLPNTQYCFYARVRNADGDVREGVGPTVVPTESFTTTANFSTVGPIGPTNVFWSPSTCTTGGLVYSAGGGCTGGSIGRTGSFTNFFSCFVRTPLTNCTGYGSVKVIFDVTHSFFASQPNDKIRMYMWSDNQFKNGACTSIKIDGVEVGFVDGTSRSFSFNQLRTCKTVEATFDLSTTTDKSQVFFYIEPNNGYNNSNVFSVALDNISVVGGPTAACLSTAPLILNGDYTIGNGGNYPSLTNAGGFFEAVNMATLSGNVTATIISDLTSESGTHGLNQWVESGAGNYTMTIRPDGATTRTISGNYNGANASLAGLFRVNGADRLIIDGRNPSDLAGGGRYLLFRNGNSVNSSLNSTFTFINDATNNIFRYLFIEGATTGAANGVILFSTAGSGDGNDGNTISECHIRDRSDAAGLPTNAIYATGTLGKLNDNNTISNNEIYNFFAAGASSNGIVITTHNTAWTISGNSFYQTAIRTPTATTINYAILIDNSTNGNNFSVTNNFIGGSQSFAGGAAWTYAGSAQIGFMGISINILNSGVSLVQGNVVRNINITSSRISAFPTNVFTGILSASNGEVTIDNNIIGSDTGNGSILIQNVTNTNAIVVGIGHSTSTGDVIIINNKVGSITITSSGPFSVSFNGIRYAQGGSSNARTISGNLIGSLTTTNSINVNTATNNASSQDVIGINMTGGANAVSILNNTIANIRNNRPTTGGGQTIGINSPFATNTITGNLIFNLTTTSNQTTTASGAMMIGISLSATAANNHSISQNTIHSLNGTGSNAISVIGIYYGGASGSTNSISRNLIHSLNSNAASGAIVSGIYMGAGAVTVANNMIRLGLDNTGASITNAHIFQGIVKDNTSTNNAIYYNSVFIGGTGVGTTANPTYAFRRIGTGNADNVRNNIFVNSRSNNSTGGKHYSVFLNNATTLTMSHNLLFVNGNGGVLAGINTTDYATLGTWVGGTAFGTATISANPQFVAPTAAVPDLHLIVGADGPGESAGIAIAGLTDDFDGPNVRTGYPQGGQLFGGGTAPDLGADESDLVPVDVTAPSFNYTNIPAQSAACAPLQTSVNVTITDGQSGISLTNNLPRMYFRRSVGAPTTAWTAINSVAGTLVSGNSNSSVWNFTINYVDFGITPSAGDQFEYYFVAQDQAGSLNVGTSQSNGSSPVHADVATIITPAGFSFGANGTYSFAPSPLSGTVTVGSGGNYPRFNGSGGLFEAINNLGLGGNLEVLVISDVAELANWTPLGVHTEYCGSGYTITIRPNSATLRTIEANASAANAMFSFYGARRVIIDGRFEGQGRFLRLRHNRVTSIYASTVEYNNGANNNVLRNCIVEGANTNLSSNTTGSVGVVRIGGSMGFASGNLNNITIEDNLITNLSNVSATLSNVPMTLVYMGGASSSATINNINIVGNDFANFQQNAVLADNGSSTTTNSIGNNITISNNNIYQELIIPTYHYPIWINALGNSFGHVISGNKIGGSSKPNPNITGTYTNNKSDGEIQAIYLNVGGTTAEQASSIQGNKIQNINISGTGWTNFVGIRVQNGRVRIGDETGNVIGSEDNSQDNIISNGSGGSSATQDSGVMGIWTQSSEEVVIENNVISGMSTGLGTFCFLDGIAHGSNMYFNNVLFTAPGGKSTIRNNVIANNRSSSNLQNSSVSNEGSISLFVHTNSLQNVIEGNLIQNNALNALTSNNVKIHGAMLGILGQSNNHGGVFRNNTIAALANANFGQSANPAAEINGLVVNYGNWEITNNMISLRNGTTGTNLTDRNMIVMGIRDHLRNLAGQAATYYHNSVYIYGQNGGAGTANPSYAYVRVPNNTGTVAGAPVTFRNNIFINNRSGIGSHRAIGNINASVPGTGWNAAASNYNFVSTLNTSVTGRWGITDYNWAGWQGISGGDANSFFAPAAATTIPNVQLLPTDLFKPQYLFGDLRLSDTNADARAFVVGKGIGLAGVTTDIDGQNRNPSTPDIGADEYAAPCILPVISAQPLATQQACLNGTPTNLSVTASNALSYQWFSNTTNNNTGGTNLGSANGAQTAIYTPPTNAVGTLYYYVEVMGTCPAPVVSQVATVQVIAPVAINLYSPLSFVNTICEGSSTSFSVTASGGGTLTYLWELSTNNGNTWSAVPNAVPYSGIGTATLSIANTPATLNGNLYRVTVSNSCGSIVSNNGTLNVNSAPVITQQPLATQTVCQNANPSNLSVTATGFSLQYQWFSNTINSNTGGVNLGSSNGAQTATYTPPTSTVGTTYYYVVLTSLCGAPVASNTASVIVQNDVAIVTQPQPFAELCQDGETNEFYVDATGNANTYQWFINTTNSNTGGVSLGVNEQAPFFMPPTDVAGTFYYYVTVTGNCNVPIASTPITVIVNSNAAPSLSIAADPAGPVCLGQNVVFTAIPTNGGSQPIYQWKVNGSNVGTNSPSYSSSSLLNGQQVTCELTSNAFCITSPTAVSNIITMSITQQPEVNAGSDLTTCETVPITFNNGAGEEYTSSILWTHNGTGTLTGAGTLNPTYTPGAGETSVVFTLTGNSTGSCPPAFDTMVLTVFINTYYQDLDGDGFGNPSVIINACTQPEGYVLNNQDFCDTNPLYNPNTQWWADMDGDGFGGFIFATGDVGAACSNPQPGQIVLIGGDCDDSNAAVFPGGPEICTNSIDDNCNGLVNENCSSVPNDTPLQATPIAISGNSFPNCGVISGTLSGAADSPESAAFTGSDVWYRFTAVSSGVSIIMSGSGQDNALVLFNNNLQQMPGNSIENVLGMGGTETLNYNNLIPGQQYFLSVGAVSGTGGAFSLCLRHLTASTCADGSGTYQLCSNLKAQWTGATNYTYNFTPTGTTGGAPTSITYSGQLPMSLASIALRYGGTYTVRIDANYNDLTFGDNQLEAPITVLGIQTCTITIAPHAEMYNQINQLCPTTLLRGSVISGKPFICGAINFTVEFTKVSNCAGTTVIGLPFEVNTTGASSSRNLNFTVPEPLTNQSFYRIRWRPNFSYGPGLYGAPGVIFIGGSATEEVELSNASALPREFKISPEAAIYPNPNVGDRFNLNVTEVHSNQVHLRILDSMGRVVYSNAYAADQSLNVWIEFSQPLSGGVYLVEITSNGEVMTERMVVTR